MEALETAKKMEKDLECDYSFSYKNYIKEMNESLIKIAADDKELADCMEVRKSVFQAEQGIDSTKDFDGKDETAEHVIVYIDTQPIGTARVRYLDYGKKVAKIERVAVLKEYRKLGIGKLIMEYLHDYLEKKGVEKTTLEAQEQAKGFYESMDYVQEGEPFEEVGISHVKMTKKLNKKNHPTVETETLNNF